MELFNLIQISLFAFIILFFIFINIKNSSRNTLVDQKLFLALVIITLSLLVTDIIRAIVNSREGLIMIRTNVFFTTLLYFLTPITSLIWTLYASYKIYEDKNRIRREFFILFPPILLNIWLLIANLSKGMFYGIIFSIDKTNIYTRGSYFLITVIISYVYLFYTLIDIVRNKKHIDDKNYFSLILFIIPPFIGGIIQSLFYGINLISISLTLSIFVIYINIQNNKLYIDALTGLYNRRKLNIYLNDVIENNRNKLVGGIMIDLDDFKAINDTFGHTEGDKALIYVADILKKNFRKEDFISRYAGDEFLIILKINKITEIKGIVERLKKNIEEFNNENITPYKLHFSIGYDVFNPDNSITSEWFISRIDNLMYKQKQYKKLSFEG